MQYVKTMKKRILPLVLTILIILAMLPAPAVADEPTSTFIGVTSDLHGTIDNLDKWLINNSDMLKYMVFCGDYNNTWNSAIIDTINANAYIVSNSVTPIYTMGNHDWGSEAAFTAKTGRTRTGIQNNPLYDGFTIYTIGARSSSANSEFTSSDIAALQNALEASDLSKPFLIFSHYPLHYGDGRTVINANAMIELLNGFPNVFFFWGHNHHSDSYMGKIFSEGEFIALDNKGTSVKLNFTYCNAGHMGYEHGLQSGKDGTGVRIEISLDSVQLDFVDLNGSVKASKSVPIKQAISITGIVPPVACAPPNITAYVSSLNAVPGAVVWLPAVSGLFEYETAYSANLVLTPIPGITFTENTFITVNGKQASGTLNPDGTLTVSYTFPETAPDPSKSVTFKKTTEIISGHEYAVVFDSVAMNNIAGAASTSSKSYTGLLYYVPYINGDYLTIDTAEKAAAATWTFTSTGDSNKWYISNGTKYLYAASSGNMSLSSSPQAWTYGNLSSSKGVQLYTSIGSTNYNLCHGGSSTVDLIYPSSNNYNNLTIYEKITTTDKPVHNVDCVITAPSAGAAPDMYAEVASGAAEAGMVSWSPIVNEIFNYSEVYEASVTFTASSGFYFTALTSVTFNGKPASSLTLNTDGSLTASYKFGPTADDPSKIVKYIKAADIQDGEEYAVVLDGVAMSNKAASGSTSYKDYTGLNYLKPTISDNYLIFSTSSQAKDATWKFTKSGEQWYIENNGKYLNGSSSGTLSLNDSPQGWIYGSISDKGTQLYVTSSSNKYNLCYGGTNTVDLIYVSSNNYNTLTIYAKQIITLESIEIITMPEINYTAGSSFNASGMVLKATYSDGSTKEITSGYEYNLTGPLAVTDTSVTIRYGDKTAVIGITVTEPVVESLTVSDAKTTYFEGESFDTTNMTVTATFTDGSSKAVTDYTVAPGGPLTTSDTSVTISYGGKSVNIPITVKANQSNIESIAVTGAKTAYFEGESFDTAIMTVTATFTDGSSIAVTGYTVTPSGPLAITDTSVTISYGGKSLSIPITVKASNVESITVTGAKTTYIEGELFDTAIITVTAAFTDGSSKVVTGYTVTPGGPLAITDTSVTISYGGKSLSIPITVKASNVESIAVTGAKTTYFEGESFDTTNIIVTATYTDGSSKAVTGYIVSPSGPLAITDTSVTVSYGGKSVSIPITVKASNVESIAVTGAKTTYFEGESFDTTNIIVTATYTDGSSKAVTGYTVTPSGPLTIDDKAVTVSYGKKSVSIPITVKASTVESIAVTGAKTSYFEGERFDTTNIIVTAAFTDGSSKAVTGYTVTPGGPLTIADKAVTISYGGKSASVSITVTALKVKSLSVSGAKTIYKAGERFDTTGMTVTATYNNGTSKVVTGYTVSPGGTLTTADKSVTISYEGVSVTIDINVSGSSSSGSFIGGSVSIAPRSKYFYDVPKSAWFYDAVQYVARKGLMKGSTMTSFEPNLPFTRAMLISILYDIEKKPAVNEGAALKDIKADMWYTSAITWAVNNSIITGYSSGFFYPDEYITREQLITILYRYVIFKGYDISRENSEPMPFTDAKSISGYAVNAMQWAYDTGMLINFTEESIKPQSYATRAEVAYYIMAILENYK